MGKLSDSIRELLDRWTRDKRVAVLGPVLAAELESERPDARPDPTLNLDGKPKLSKKRRARKPKGSKR